MADMHFREQYRDAVSCLIRDQERAGLDIVTDGDARFDTDVGGRSWVSYVVQRLQGFSGYETSRSHATWGGSVPGEIVYEVLEARALPRVTGPVGPGPLEYAQLWRTAQQMTSKPVKLGSISPDCLESIVGNDHYRDRRQLVLDLCDVMHDEFLRLAGAGCRVFQVEEPWVHRFEHHREDRGMSREFYVEAFNRSVRGLRDRLELWCHTCWGNPAQQRFYDTHKSYGPALEAMNGLDVDVLTFECASTDGMDLESIGRAITRPKIAIGVIDHRVLQVERPEAVAALIRKALGHIPAERLCVSTDCGFGREGMARRHAFYKMVALVRGTNLVRKELGVPEAPIPAMDPGLTLADGAGAGGTAKPLSSTSSCGARVNLMGLGSVAAPWACERVNRRTPGEPRISGRIVDHPIDRAEV
jgi:5-methyltetrahydropteroyltriglutamate--homocysteine methyltransferase